MRRREQRKNRKATASSVFARPVFLLNFVIFVVLLISIIIRTTVITRKPAQSLIMSIITVVVVGFCKIRGCVSFKGITSPSRTGRRRETGVSATIDSTGTSPGTS
jgi:quinol-cytochrome oxidoreductase complex cytochrome b subunit